MILIVLAGLCALSVPLTGGRLSRLADIRLRGLWLPIVALALQVVITVLAPGGSPTAHRAAHLLSYAVLGLFLVLNRRLAGVRTIAVGATLNVTAIAANGGVMPASRTAERVSGLIVRHGFDNSAYVHHALLPWLGDVIPWPGPLANVLSVGDLLIFAGTAVFLHRSCRPRTTEPPSGSRPASRPGSGRSGRPRRGRGSIALRSSRGPEASLRPEPHPSASPH